MDAFDLVKFNRIYFCGICGVSMSGLAKHLLNLGKTVGGSDRDLRETSRQLERLGAKVYKGNNLNHLKDFNPDLVIYTSAIPKNSPELVFCSDNGIPVIKRSQLLGEIVKGFKKSIAVCGSHGKTTTTAMLANALISARLNPTVFVGGYDVSFGNYLKGGQDVVVFEACEYERNFLDIKPTHAVVLNIDNDHMDTYKNLKDVQEAFRLFVKESVCLLNADDLSSRQIENHTTVTFGIENNATYTAKNIKRSNGGASFTLYRNGLKRFTVNLSVLGKHNVSNALSVCAMADLLGTKDKAIKEGLFAFKGVNRRMERLGKIDGKVCIADYAHHPSEINATFNAINAQNDLRATSEEDVSEDLFVFQPHTYSRTKYLMKEFIEVLSKINNLIVYKSYPARETYDKRGSAKRLFNELIKMTKGNVLYANTLKHLEQKIKEFPHCKRIFLLGAGDLYDKVKKIVNKSEE